MPLTQASYAMPNRSGSLLVLVVTYGPVDGPAALFEACSAMTVDAPTLPPSRPSKVMAARPIGRRMALPSAWADRTPAPQKAAIRSEK